MRLAAALAAALLLTLAAAAPAPVAAATSTPDDGSSNIPTTATTTTCLLLHLRDRNMRALERRAAEAAGRAGPRAGAYLTVEQVAQLAGRSMVELRALSAFVSSLGGQMQEVGPLRDLAAACFPAPTLASLSAAAEAAAQGSASAGSQSAEQAELVAVTRQAAAAAATRVTPAAVAAAHALAAALPPQLARFTAAIEPLPPLSQHASPGTAAAGADGSVGSSSNSSGGASPSFVRHRSLLEQQQQQAGSGAASPATQASTRWQGPITTNQGGPLQPPTFGAGEGVSAAAAGGGSMPAWQPVSVQFALNVSSGYGPPLPAILGNFTGFANQAVKTAWGVPQFSAKTLLYFLGVSSAATMLNSINSSMLGAAVMLPCQLALGPGNTVTRVTYATAATAAACAGQFTVSFRESYAANPGKLSPVRSVALPPTAVRVLSCGAAVARSGGRLPASTCASIGRQLAAANNLSAPIGPNTALYHLDVAAVLPTFTGINSLTISVRLAPSVPAIYRSFGLLSALIQVYPLSVARRNRPRELRPLYGAAPLENRGTAKGLLVAPSLFVPAPYAYSPTDLSTINKALGVTVPPVVEVANPPVFPRNRPALCYQQGFGGCGEPSLDIQAITQYGQGSGAAFGFVASSMDQSFANISTAGLYRATLNLKPLPDVLSWSWGGASMDPAAGAQPFLAEQLLAKMAAMGITVLVSSGDSGAFLPGATAATACQQPITPSYPAASQWVTAVGAVMEARPAAGQPPQLVACMAPIGGVITSGGGFGNTSFGATPAWQAKAVQRYVASQRGKASWPLSAANRGSNGAGIGVNCTGSGASERCVYGRGYPDISLVGAGVPLMVAGQPAVVYGTSISAPVFAGLVMQLNAAIRANPGLERCKIGYMTPFLYWAAERYPTAFTDITVGSNRFNEIQPTACSQGYHAAAGWDAVTGLGVPNMRVLQKAAVEYVRSQAGCARKPQ